MTMRVGRPSRANAGAARDRARQQARVLSTQIVLSRTAFSGELTGITNLSELATWLDNGGNIVGPTFLIGSADVAMEGSERVAVTVTDAAVTSTSRIICSVQRDVEAEDRLAFLSNVLAVRDGEFDAYVQVVFAPSILLIGTPPEETVKLQYLVYNP